ncbi:peptidoglycan-binding protein [Streptomyces mirabilis]
MPAKRLAVVGAVSVATVAIAAGVVLKVNAHTSAGPPTGSAKVATVTVTRTDLSDTRTLQGTLGYGTATPVNGHGSGVVTALPGSGDSVKRGHVLCRIDDQPVVLFYGSTPLFRTLTAASGKAKPMRGRDVTVVADNLQALGYDIGYRPPDTDGLGDTYTASLAYAVKRWQRYVGMKQTGTLSEAQIVVTPGAVRVGSVQAHLGDPAQEPVLSVTSTAKMISVSVEADNAQAVTKGAKVGIILPDNRTVAGTVASVGQTVHSDQDPDSQDQPPSLTVIVTPSQSDDVAKLASAPVQVTFTTGTRHNVLTVPVTALVALKEGGYALQRTDGAFVSVTTGLFADGKVEVSGAGVTAGMRVEAAS